MRKLFTILLAASQCWGALSFGAANTDKVNCGSAAAIDTLSLGTIAFWYKPVSTANVYRIIIAKTNYATEGFTLNQRGSDGTGLYFESFRATASAEVTSTTGALSAGAWSFIAITFDSTGGAAPIMYKGSLTAAAADVSSGAAAGSGTYGSDAAHDLIIGNATTTSTESANGVMDAVGIWKARRLTAGEIIDYQFRSRPTASNVFFSRLQTTANHSDWSSSANACVVTGATLADGVPTGPWFGFDVRKFLGIDYETHLNRTIFAD